MLPSTDSSLLSGGGQKVNEQKEDMQCGTFRAHERVLFRQSVGLQAVHLYSKKDSSWRGQTTFSSKASNQSYPAEGRLIRCLLNSVLHSSTCNDEVINC